VPGPSTAFRRTRAVLVALAVLLVVAGCTNRQQIPDSYGGTTRDNFTEGCVTTLTSDDGEGEAFDADEANEICECSYNGIKDNIPFEDFKRINEDQSAEPGPLDERITDIVDGCTDSLR